MCFSTHIFIPLGAFTTSVRRNLLSNSRKNKHYKLKSCRKKSLSEIVEEELFTLQVGPSAMMSSMCLVDERPRLTYHHSSVVLCLRWCSLRCVWVALLPTSVETFSSLGQLSSVSLASNVVLFSPDNGNGRNAFLRLQLLRSNLCMMLTSTEMWEFQVWVSLRSSQCCGSPLLVSSGRQMCFRQIHVRAVHPLQC